MTLLVCMALWLRSVPQQLLPRRFRPIEFHSFLVCFAERCSATVDCAHCSAPDCALCLFFAACTAGA